GGAALCIAIHEALARERRGHDVRVSAPLSETNRGGRSMLAVTRATRTGSRGASRSTPLETRPWPAAGPSRDAAEAATGRHDPAHIGVSAPAAPIQRGRVRQRAQSLGARGDAA